MASKYSSGKHSIAECDRCGQRYKLSQLRKLTIKLKQVSIKVCPECWEMDQPQLHLGLFPINDPQAVREPRPDVSYAVSGIGVDGEPQGGSRVFQWSWNPVGGSRNFDIALTPNDLMSQGQVGTVTISTT
jgi:hypothetical protein